MPRGAERGGNAEVQRSGALGVYLDTVRFVGWWGPRWLVHTSQGLVLVRPAVLQSSVSVDGGRPLRGNTLATLSDPTGQPAWLSLSLCETPRWGGVVQCSGCRVSESPSQTKTEAPVPGGGLVFGPRSHSVGLATREGGLPRLCGQQAMASSAFCGNELMPPEKQRKVQAVDKPGHWAPGAPGVVGYPRELQHAPPMTSPARALGWANLGRLLAEVLCSAGPERADRRCSPLPPPWPHAVRCTSLIRNAHRVRP